MFDYLTDTSTMPTEVISVSQGDLSCPIGFCNFDGDVWINIEFEYLPTYILRKDW